METESVFTRWGFLVMAATAGAITSLYTQQWRKMGATEIVLSIFVSMSFALLGAPWLVSTFWPMDDMGLRAACGITYFGASAAHVTIPVLIRKIRDRVAKDEGLEP